MTKNILWFSRHVMDAEQKEALVKAFGSDIKITQINGTAPNVHVGFVSTQPEGTDESVEVVLGEVKPLKELVKDFDVVCAVLPINLLQQLLPFCPQGILQTVNKRLLLDEGKVAFKFDKWEIVREIVIVKEDLL